MPATMTTYGLYNYDPTLFDKLRVPQGIDKQTVINQIILDTWELELLYPTPNFLKAAIGFWSDTNQDIWQKLWDSEHFDYNPIWNVDGDVYEDGTAFKNRAGNNSETGLGSETQTGTDYRNKAGNNAETGSGSETESGTDYRNKAGNNTETETDDVTNTQSVKGFNSSSWAEHEQNVTDDDRSKTGSFSEGETGGNDSEKSMSDTRTGTFAEGETGGDSRTTDRNDSRNGSFSEGETGGDSRHTRRTGNIGVTTTQQMIREERDVDQFSTIKFISQSFKKQFCLLVY